MLGIIVALEYEIDFSQFDYNEVVIDYRRYFLLKDEKAVFCFAGVGKANAASATTDLIHHFCPESIINIGSSCTINPHLSTQVIHLPVCVEYADVDVSCDSQYKINQIPYEPKTFFIDLKILNNLCQLFTNNGITFVSNKALCIDSFVTQQNLFKFHNLKDPEVYSIDMESAAIAQICNQKHICFALIKTISDKISLNNHDDFIKNIPSISRLNTKIVKLILTSF